MAWKFSATCVSERRPACYGGIKQGVGQSGLLSVSYPIPEQLDVRLRPSAVARHASILEAFKYQIRPRRDVVVAAEIESRLLLHGVYVLSPKLRTDVDREPNLHVMQLLGARAEVMCASWSLLTRCVAQTPHEIKLGVTAPVSVFVEPVSIRRTNVPVPIDLISVLARSSSVNHPRYLEERKRLARLGAPACAASGAPMVARE